MKRANIIYWVLTGLLAALMLLSSIPDIMSVKEAVIIVKDHLGYPVYFIPFIGVAKLLGVIAILVPGFPRIREWAYAGFVFDLIAAMYSSCSVGDKVSQWLPLSVGLVLIFASYFAWHRKMKLMASS